MRPRPKGKTAPSAHIAAPCEVPTFAAASSRGRYKGGGARSGAAPRPSGAAVPRPACAQPPPPHAQKAPPRPPLPLCAFPTAKRAPPPSLRARKRCLAASRMHGANGGRALLPWPGGRAKRLAPETRRSGPSPYRYPCHRRCPSPAARLSRTHKKNGYDSIQSYPFSACIRVSYPCFSFLNSSIKSGTTSLTSPTIPASATSKIGASSSLLIARMKSAAVMPLTCWVAPETPQPM